MFMTVSAEHLIAKICKMKSLNLIKSLSMKNLFYFLLAAICLTGMTSCEKVVGEGPVVAQVRALEDFKSVSVSITGEVIYKIAPSFKVELRAQQNILDIIQTNKVGNDLVIKFKDGKNVRSHEDIAVVIEAPALELANLSGAANLDIQGEVSGANLGLRISGSGNIKVQRINITDKVSATISGSGNIMVLDGIAKNEVLKVSGSGNIHMEDVFGTRAETEISGSGNIQVKLSQHLDARISGSGSVFYLGTPQVVSHISGSGTVKPI